MGEVPGWCWWSCQRPGYRREHQPGRERRIALDARHAGLVPAVVAGLQQP
ncbi:hypothetical protein [Actinoplanes awajinensis]|nr:hypothetical protein [Actinoplanes awajinensis]